MTACLATRASTAKQVRGGAGANHLLVDDKTTERGAARQVWVLRWGVENSENDRRDDEGSVPFLPALSGGHESENWDDA